MTVIETIGSDKQVTRILNHKDEYIREYYFSAPSFNSSHGQVLSLMKAEKLSFLCCRYVEETEEKMREKGRKELVHVLCDLQEVKKIFINLNTSRPLFLQADLFRFIYRTPISQGLQSVYLVGLNPFDKLLARAFKQSSMIEKLTVSYTNYRQAPKYAFQYYSSHQLRSITARQMQKKDSFALFHLYKRAMLEYCEIDLPEHYPVIKYVFGMLLKSTHVSQFRVQNTWSMNQSLMSFFRVLTDDLKIKF